MKTQYSPTAARQNLYGIIQEVNDKKEAIEIVSKGKAGVAVIPLDDWRSIQETMFLEQAGVMAVVREREKDSSGVTDINEIDWDEL